MITYNSKTGYVKCSIDGTCYEAKTIYCPDGADLTVYADISQADYEAYQKAKEAEMEEMLNKEGMTNGDD